MVYGVAIIVAIEYPYKLTTHFYGYPMDTAMDTIKNHRTN